MSAIDMNLVRSFLEREPFTAAEKKVKDKCIYLDKSYSKALQELQEKDQEVHSLKSHLEAMILLAYELELDYQNPEIKQEGEEDGA